MQVDNNSAGKFKQSWKLGISEKESSPREIQPRVNNTIDAELDF
jgi:hypothetical protein